MRRFSDAYKEARAAIIADRYVHKSWPKFMESEVGASMIFASAGGPSVTHGRKLDKLRTKLAARTKGTEGEFLLTMAGVNPTGSQALTSTQARSVATLKLLRHFYLEHKQGAQSLWIYASPFSLHKWIYDEISGLTASAAKTKLDKIDEVYNGQTRAKLVTATNEALRWCGVCQSKLGKPDTATRAKIITWFHPGSTVPLSDVNKTAKSLCAGFRDICVLLKANKLIYSDDPIDRMKGSAVAGQSDFKTNWNAFGFVAADRGEKLDVVYVQRGILRRLGGTDEWMAVLAIVHELSHRVIGTKDAVYDSSGLKPSTVLTNKHALKNADSWAYFCADINNKIPTVIRTKYYKAPAALRQSYLNWVAARSGGS